jgi:shikimate dehydrogenase
MNIRDFIKLLPNQRRPFSALIGEKTYYSVSPLMHNEAANFYKLDFEYFAIDVSETDFSFIPEILNHELCKGFNITIPYKEKILDFVEVKSDLVSRLNAANVIYKSANKICADNTDVYGFKYPLTEIQESSKITKAFIFGTGGASRAAEQGLKELGINSVYQISRNPKGNQLSYETWFEHVENLDVSILVNASPLGMTTNREKSPISKEDINHIKPLFCYDLIYNPAKTTFINFAEEVGVNYCLNGLEMLIRQGSKAFEIWNGIEFPIEEVKKRLAEKS